MRSFTEEQDLFRDSYRKFLEAEVAPRMPEFEKNGIVDREIFKKAADCGFLMVWPDEEYGGLGLTDFRYEQIIIEETTRAGCISWYNTLHSRLVGPYLNKFGNAEQKARFLPSCVSGDKILAVAMTEPDAGSDLSGMKTTLKNRDGKYYLNGQKTFISNGINADLVVVAAKTDSQNNPHAMALCVVERGMGGFSRGRNLDKMGMKAQDTAELFFENVQIPEENILGDIGQGFYYLMSGLAEERLIGATGFIANARRAFNVTREFVMERQVFGRKLSDMQNTQFKLAEMDTEIEITQCFIDHCVELHNRGELSANKAAKAKLQASEVEWKMLDLGVQLHGGAGFMQEYEICTMFTDSRINRIMAGTSEIMKLIIGRDIFSDKYSSILD